MDTHTHTQTQIRIFNQEIGGSLPFCDRWKEIKE